MSENKSVQNTNKIKLKKHQ